MAGLAWLRDDAVSCPRRAERYVADGRRGGAGVRSPHGRRRRPRPPCSGGPGRRVVVVVEVADPDGAVPLRDVVAVHADPDGPAGRTRTPSDGARPGTPPRRSRTCVWARTADTFGGMDAITFPPAPVNEPNLTYAPGSPERGPAGGARAAGAAASSTLTAYIGGRWKDRRRRRDRGRPAARPPARAGRAQGRDAGRRPGRDRGGRPTRRREWRATAIRRPGRGPAQGRRAAGRPVAAAAQRGDDARPVQDRVPGRDRRGLRADRLLAVQRPLRPADPRRAADREQPGHLEPHRPPPARGLRLRDHAVQLHRDRRQPADRAGADGQHRGLEAVADPAARGAPDHGAAGGGRAAAGRHQHAARRRHRGLQGGARAPRPGRHPLHRLDADLPAPVAHRRREHRDVPLLPAHRRRDRRQGLRRRAPVGRPGRAADRADPRRVRVPGPEVLGGLARLRRRGRCGTRCSDSFLAEVESLPMGDVTDFSNFMGAVIDDRAFAKHTQAIDRAKRSRKPGRPRRWHSSTTRSAASCGPPSSRVGDPTDEMFTTEYFGPILAVHVYDDARLRAGRPADGVRRAVRPDRLDHRPGPQGDRVGAGGAALRGRQLLHQRQADRRGRRAAAVRRRPGVGHQRQGRRRGQPAALDLAALDQGDASSRRPTTATRTWAEPGAMSPTCSRCTSGAAPRREGAHPGPGLRPVRRARRGIAFRRRRTRTAVTTRGRAEPAGALADLHPAGGLDRERLSQPVESMSAPRRE